jgi:hypothetical protein
MPLYVLRGMREEADTVEVHGGGEGSKAPVGMPCVWP